MSAMSIPMLPESAPFSPAQRAWLNGFFAGLVSRGAPAVGGDVPRMNGAPAVSGEGSSALLEPAPEAEEDFPWHDPSLPIDERLTLAEGKPRERVLMAAMAQLDCGACGYLCQSYAEAIATGEEKDLTKCAPGAKETAVKLKELVQLKVSAAAAPVKAATAPAPTAGGAKAAAKSGKWDRNNPFPATVVQAAPLNREGSAKDTRHVVFDLKGSGMTYEAGDALGVYPENCPDLVDWVLDALDAGGNETVLAPDKSKVSLRDALLKHYTITKPRPKLVTLLADAATDPKHAAALRELVADDGPGMPDGHEVLDLLVAHPSAKPKPADFVASLSPMQARLYSISSSLKAHPDEVHLTVGVVRYLNPLQRQCQGVTSTFLSDRAAAGQKVRVFVHHSPAFRVPTDPSAAAIMVGPGTGVAPFRAFLEERKATGATGRNWLLFGDQSSQFDFLYQQELEQHLRDGTLSHLDTAFSRDQTEKVYVQHRMLQNAGRLWAWLQAGGHFYVCGDAKRMAADVDAALKHVVAEQGNMSAEAAEEYVASLAKAKRYCRDVY